MTPDQTASKDQSDLGPFYVQYRLPKNISRQKEKTKKVVNDKLAVYIEETSH